MGKDSKRHFTGSRLRGSQGCSQGPRLEVLISALSSCWQNSVPCGCRNEFPIVWPAVSWELCSAPGGPWLSLPHRPFTTWMFLIFPRPAGMHFSDLLCDRGEHSLLLKGSPDQVMSTLISSLFPYNITMEVILHCIQGSL